jgi:Trypsin-co-occurring domain 2
MSRLDVALTAVALVLVAIVLYRQIRVLTTDQTADANPLALNVFVEGVRSQLVQLEQERLSKNQTAITKLDSFDLEVNFVVKKKSTSKAELEYEVVTVGTEAENATEKTQKIVLHMKPEPVIAGSTPPEPEATSSRK